MYVSSNTYLNVVGSRSNLRLILSGTLYVIHESFLLLFILFFFFSLTTLGFCHVHGLRLSKCGRIELKLGGTQWDPLCVFPGNAGYSASGIYN